MTLKETHRNAREAIWRSLDTFRGKSAIGRDSVHLVVIMLLYSKYLPNSKDKIIGFFDIINTLEEVSSFDLIINELKKVTGLKIDYLFDAGDILKGKKNIHISDLNSDFLLITGIADSKPLTRHLKSKKLKFKHLTYNDHHNYNQNDIKEILKYSGDKIILTTEKDYFKIMSIHDFKNLFYIEIKIDFLGKSNDLVNLISNKLIFN